MDLNKCSYCVHLPSFIFLFHCFDLARLRTDV